MSTAMVSRDAQDVFDAHVDEHLRRNYAVNLLYGLFGTTGFRLIMVPTFVPQYIKTLSGSNTIVGLLQLVGAVFRVGSPMFAVSFAEVPLTRLRVVGMGILMRVQILLMALAGFFLPDPINLVAFFVVYGFFNLFLGYQNVLYNTTMAKVIPTRVRGSFIGWRNFLGGLTAWGVARLAARWTEDLAFPGSYAWIFLASFVMTSIGIGFFAMTKEAPTPMEHDPPPPVPERLRRMWAMIHADRSFRNYVIARVLSTTSFIAQPFYIIYAKESLGLGIGGVAVITSYMFFSQTVMDPIWGRVADRLGFRFVFLFGLSAWILATCILLFVTPTLMLMNAVFALLGAATGGYQMSTNNLVLEFGTMQERPQRIAIASMASEAMRGIAPFAGGLLADAFGYSLVFWVSFSCLITSAFVMFTMVAEPRFAKTPQAPPG